MRDRQPPVVDLSVAR